MTNRILIYFGQVVLLNGVIKNREEKRPGFSIEFEMARFTILYPVHLNDLPVNYRFFSLPEKQVIRNGAIKKLRNEVECFFVAE